MITRSRAIAAALAAGVATVLLAGCGPTTPTTEGTTPPASQATSSAAQAPAASSTPVVKDLAAGNCTMFPKESAVKLIGPINMNNNALDIGSGGGTKIDVCSYMNLQAVTIQAITYAVVRFDSPDAAYAQAQRLRGEMLDSASDHDWAVQSLTAPVPGAGPLVGGYGTKTESGVTFTIAVVGTNVGPYLVAALGGSTSSADDAKRFALATFQALATAAS